MRNGSRTEVNLDTASIHKQLEQLLGIVIDREISQIDSKDNYKLMFADQDQYYQYINKGSGVNPINLKIRYAPDKSFETIMNKLSRKSSELNDANIPWYSTIIKDAKRMSILFESENDMWLYICQLRKLFGEDFSRNDLVFRDTGMRLRIVEIKNDFKILENVDYKGE